MANKLNNLELCEIVEHKQSCVGSVMSSKNNPELCEQTEIQEISDMCYYSLATRLIGRQFCKEIKSPEISNNCDSLHRMNNELTKLT